MPNPENNLSGEPGLNKVKAFRKICNKVALTIHEHQLIGEGDDVLVGLSGGKDSFILLEALARHRRSARFSFSLTAVHVAVEGPGYSIDCAYLQDFCHELEVPLHILNTRVDFNTSEKSPCFVCSWHRRKAIFGLSKKLGSTKIAFGHHRDDALQTFLMNLVYHGSISSLPYSIGMFEGRLRLIRPLLDIYGDELEAYAGLRQYRKEETKCPFDNRTRRSETEKLLHELESWCPGAKTRIFNGLTNVYPDYLPVKSARKAKP
jgi:tRNA(Ile)-lysidine synthase TilS/MesJ